MTEEATKTEAEDILYTLARLYTHKGQAKEVAFLADAEPTLIQTDYNNWDGGIYSYTLFLKIALAAYTQISADIEEIEGKLRDDVSQLF